jgi:hypothetical protein
MTDEQTVNRAVIFAEINHEREEQDSLPVDTQRDQILRDDPRDQRERWEYRNFITENIRRADWHGTAQPEGFESQMVKIAALAVAAIESSRRRRA